MYHQFEATQPCTPGRRIRSARNATKLGATGCCSTLFKSEGSHKPGFEEIKAYDMLNERMDRFSKLPPAMGKRVDVSAEMMAGAVTRRKILPNPKS